MGKLIFDRAVYYTRDSWDVGLYEVGSDILIGKSYSLSNSTVNLNTESTPVRGGSDNQILFYIPTGRELPISLESVAFELPWLALQAASTFTIGKHTILGNMASVNVVESAGKRTIELPEIPVGTCIYVESGTEQIPVKLDTAGTKVVDVTSITDTEDTCLVVTYAAEKTASHLAISSSEQPKVIKLVMTKNVYNGDNEKVYDWVMEINKFQPDGNLEIAGALGSNDTTKLNGNAMASKSSVCGDTKQTLADIYLIPVSEDAFKPQEITTDANYEVAIGEVDNIIVYAKYASKLIFESQDVSAKAEYESDDPTVVEVEDGGKITGVSSGIAKVTIKYGGKTTTTEVMVD